MLSLAPESENISTKPSSPNHSFPGDTASKDNLRFNDFLDPSASKFEIEYLKDLI